MAKAGNVLVPSVFELGEPQGKPDKPLPAAVPRARSTTATLLAAGRERQ
jgi:hypothetical protein